MPSNVHSDFEVYHVNHCLSSSAGVVPFSQTHFSKLLGAFAIGVREVKGAFVSMHTHTKIIDLIHIGVRIFNPNIFSYFHLRFCFTL